MYEDKKRNRFLLSFYFSSLFHKQTKISRFYTTLSFFLHQQYFVFRNHSSVPILKNSTSFSLSLTNFMDFSHIFKFSLDLSCRLINPLKRVHVCIQDASNLNNRVRLVLIFVGSIEMLNNLPEIIRHSLELSIQSLSKLVSPLPFRIWRRGRGKRSLERSQDILKLSLLALNEIQFVLQTLKVRYRN